jgi:hypothetical protein
MSTAVAEPVLDMDLEKAVPCEIGIACTEPAHYRLFWRPVRICPHRIMLACATHMNVVREYSKKCGDSFCHDPCGVASRILLMRIEAL